MKRSCIMVIPVTRIYITGDWIKDWTDTCLNIYGVLAENNPGYLNYFTDRKA